MLASLTTAPVGSITNTTSVDVFGDWANAGVAAITHADTRTNTLLTIELLLGADHVILEIAGAVGLGPEANAPLHGRTQHRVVLGKQIGVRRRAVAAGSGRTAQRVLERGRSVHPGADRGPVNRHLQLVVRRAIEHELVGAIAELPQPAQAVVKFPEADVVLGVVVADGEPVAVRLDVEEDPRRAIRLAGNRLELDADRPVRKGVDRLEDGDRV